MVYVKEIERAFYPDAYVAYGPPEFHEGVQSRRSITNPRVVFEVLSQSNASYDRGQRMGYCMSIPSVEQIAFIAQEEPVVELLTRRPEGWLMNISQSLDAKVLLASLEIEMPLLELYLNVEFALSVRPGLGAPDADQANPGI